MSEITLDHHLHSFGEGDIEAILEDYSEESVIIIPNTVIRGLSEIRDFFTNLVTEVLPPGCNFHLHDKVVIDNIAYLVWHADSDSYVVPFASDTFVFDEDDKIAVQTIAFVLQEKED
ncbi:MAG: nuclear transport factor 2 family protein [Thermodesulfobacteriota bacterium]